MPRDKTATYEKIIRCMKEEFLTFGYEKASLNRVSAKVGITTAGLYKHFRNKEDMFFSLVKDMLDAFHSVAASSTHQMETETEYNPFDDDWAMFWVDFIYKHYVGVKLLICCSKGSAYENFEEDLIRKEAEANKEYADILRASGTRVGDAVLDHCGEKPLEHHAHTGPGLEPSFADDVGAVHGQIAHRERHAGRKLAAQRG